MAQFFGTALDDVLDGTAAHDRFDLSQGGSDIAHGARGDDHFFLGGAFNAADAIDGGTGDDTLVLAGDYGVTFGPDTLRSVETLRLADGFYYYLTLDDANAGAGRVDLRGRRYACHRLADPRCVLGNRRIDHRDRGRV